MVLDERKDFLVQLLKQDNVLNVVALHTSLSSFVSSHHLLPKVEAFVLELTTNLQQRADVSQAVHKEPKLLDRLDDVDACGWRRGLETG